MPRLRFRMPKMQFGINFYDIKTINSVLWYFRLSYPLSFFFSSWSYFSTEKLFLTEIQTVINKCNETMSSECLKKVMQLGTLSGIDLFQRSIVTPKIVNDICFSGCSEDRSDDKTIWLCSQTYQSILFDRALWLQVVISQYMWSKVRISEECIRKTTMGNLYVLIYGERLSEFDLNLDLK